MAQEVGNLVVKVGLDGTGFQNGISNLNRSLRVVQSEFQAAAAKLGDFGKSAEGLKLKADSLSQQIELQRKKVDLLQAAFQKSAETKGRDAKATQELEIKLNKTRAQLADMENELRKTNQQIEEQSGKWGKLSHALKSVTSSGNEARGTFQRMAETMKSGFLFGAGVAGFYGLADAIKSVVSSGVNFDSQMEQAQNSFEVMLGSAEKAKQMVAELQQFANNTPFEFPQLQNAAERMLAFGFAAQDILPILKAVGDAARGNAEKIDRISLALGQMRVKGKVSAEEMLQLTEAGVNGWKYLAEATGKTTAEVQKMASDGLIPANLAIQAIVKGMERDFPNMMDKQSRSFQGLVSTLKDNLNSTFGQVMKPVFDYLTNTALPKLIQLTNNFKSTLENKGLKEAFKTIFPPALVDTIVGIGRVIGQVFSFIRNHIDGIKVATAALLGGFLAFKTVTGIINMTRAAFEALNFVIQMNPIVRIISIIIAVVAALYEAWVTDWGGIQEKTYAVVSAIVAFFKNMAVNISIAFNRLKRFVYEVILDIMDFVSPAVNLIGEVAPGVKNWFDQTMASVANGVSEANLHLEDLRVQAEQTSAALSAAGAEVKAAFSSWSTPQPKAGWGNFRELEQGNGFNIDLSNWNMADAAGSLADLGEKAKKSAEDTREAWEVAADALQSKLRMLQAQFDLFSATMGFNRSESQKLADKLQFLNQEYRIQEQIVEQVRQGYEQMLATKGENAKETVDAAEKYAQEAKNLADLRNQINETTLALLQQQNVLERLYGSDYWGQERIRTIRQSNIDLLKTEIEYLEREGASQDELNQAQQKRAQLLDLYAEKQLEYQHRVREQQTVIDELNQAYARGEITLKDYQQALAEATKNLNEVKAQAVQLSKEIEDSFKGVTDRFTEMTKRQLDAFVSAKNKELEAMKTAHKQALDMFDAETKALLDNIDRRIKALDEQAKAEDRASQEKSWAKQMENLQHRLDVAKLMGDDRTVRAVQQEIADFQDQVSKQRRQWERDDQKAALQAEKDRIQKERDERRKALEQMYADQEAAFQRQIEQQQRYLQALQDELVKAIQTRQLTQQQANMAWLQAIKDTGDQQVLLEIQAQELSQQALNAYVQSYVEIGKSYGQSLAQGVIDGLNSMLSAVQAAAARLRSAAAGVMGAAVSAATFKVPALATGGVITAPTLALLGEKPSARPEIAAPEPLLRKIIREEGGGGNRPINIYMDSKLIGSYVWDAATGQLRQLQRKGVTR